MYVYVLNKFLYCSHNSVYNLYDLTYTTTIYFNCYYSRTLFRVHNYNWDLHTAIILFTCNVSSHKIDWILSALPLLALPCIVYRRASTLMNGLKGECCLFMVHSYVIGHPIFYRWDSKNKAQHGIKKDWPKIVSLTKGKRNIKEALIDCLKILLPPLN